MLPGQLAFTSLKHPKLEVLIYLSIYLTLTFLLTVAFSLFFDLLSIRDIQIQNNQKICSTRKKIRNFVYFFYFSQSKSRTNCCGFLKLISWRHLKIHLRAILKKIISQNLVKIFVDYEYVFWWFGCHECVVSK